MNNEQESIRLSVSLEKHYDRLLDDQKELMLSKFENIRESIVKAEGYTAYRDEKQNEFRGSLDDVNQRLADQAKNFSTKSDLENLNKQFDIWMSGMKQLQEANFGVAMDMAREVKKDVEAIKERKIGSAAVLPWIVSAILFIMNIVTLVKLFGG